MNVIVMDFPKTWYARAWAWLLEDEDANLDDTSPRTYDDFVAEMERRREAGELLYGVEVDTEPSGIIGVLRAGEVAYLHGICFRQAVHGTGAARQAVAFVLHSLREVGVRKVSAQYFADNARLDAFLRKFGAVHEGRLRAHTTRHGQPVDLQVVALWLRPWVG